MKTFTKNFLLILLFSLPILSVFSQNQKHELPRHFLCLSENYQPVLLTFPEGIKSIFSEDFSSGCPPTSWTVIGDGQTKTNKRNTAISSTIRGVSTIFRKNMEKQVVNQ